MPEECGLRQCLNLALTFLGAKSPFIMKIEIWIMLIL